MRAALRRCLVLEWWLLAAALAPLSVLCLLFGAAPADFSVLPMPLAALGGLNGAALILLGLASVVIYSLYRIPLQLG